MNLVHLAGLYRGDRYDPLIVCHVENAVAANLGAARGRILLSIDTMEKQHRRHPDLTLDHYRALPACLCRGEYRQDEPNGAVVTYVDTVMFGTNFRAYVKACSRGILWVTSFNLLRDRHLKKELRQPHPVIRPHD